MNTLLKPSGASIRCQTIQRRRYSVGYELLRSLGSTALPVRSCGDRHAAQSTVAPDARRQQQKSGDIDRLGALLVFGVICTAVALYQGYETEATPEGVAYATTRTVVIASLSVLCMDFVLTALMFTTG